MANRYFKVEKDTSIPRAYRAVRDNSGTVYDYETEGIAYDAGQVVAEADIDPRVVERFDDGDEHLNSLLSEVSAEEASQYDADVKAANQNVRLPEHSVEAYVLASDVEENYALLSSQQGLDLASAGAEQAKDALAARKEEIGDTLTEADDRSAIDFATAKGGADKEAGENLQPAEVVAGEQGVDAPSVPEVVEPTGPSLPPGVNPEVPVEVEVPADGGEVVVNPDPAPETPATPAEPPAVEEVKTAKKSSAKKEN